MYRSATTRALVLRRREWMPLPPLSFPRSFVTSPLRNDNLSLPSTDNNPKWERSAKPADLRRVWYSSEVLENQRGTRPSASSAPIFSWCKTRGFCMLHDELQLG